MTDDVSQPESDYAGLFEELVQLPEQSRRAVARAVNTTMTATYWEIGRRMIEFEQHGASRAEYGDYLLDRLAADLTNRFGRGFSRRNVAQMRQFYLSRPIVQTLSAQSSHVPPLPLPWSHYVRLLGVKETAARAFYEAEAAHGGWSVRQLDRQIATRFYERTLLSRDKAAMLTAGALPRAADAISPEEAIKDPFVLEFLDLKDEYTEHALEEALIRHLESFLLELGGGFTFVARQRRLRVGDAWYRVDLLFFHRRLRCLIVVDLKLGSFSQADAGQMHLYVNYAREHWMLPEENPPVGLILCAAKDAAVAHYALGGLPNTVLAAEYRLALPDEQLLAAELARTRLLLEQRQP